MTITTASDLMTLEALIVGSLATLADAERLAARISGLPLKVRESLILASLHANRALARVGPAVAVAVEVVPQDGGVFVGEIT